MPTLTLRLATVTPTPLTHLSPSLCTHIHMRRQEVRSGGGIRVDEAAMTVTVPAGVTQRTLLEALDAYRCVNR
jgi:hypothetical protein